MTFLDREHLDCAALGRRLWLLGLHTGASSGPLLPNYSESADLRLFLHQRRSKFAQGLRSVATGAIFNVDIRIERPCC